MKNIPSIAMALALGFTFSSSAHALSVQPIDGILDQEKPDWIEALPIPTPLNPSVIQEIRAANLIIHEEVDKLHIVSPTYERAHRLLLQHLLMMERQTHFNDATLAKFNASSHQSRFTIDARIYPRGNADGSAVISPLPNTLVVTGTDNERFRYDERVTRRSIIRAAQEAGRLRELAWK